MWVIPWVIPWSVGYSLRCGLFPEVWLFPEMGRGMCTTASREKDVHNGEQIGESVHNVEQAGGRCTTRSRQEGGVHNGDQERRKECTQR